jgi:DNA polymerase
LHIVMPNGTSLVYPNAYAKEERTPFGSKRLILGYESERGHGWGPVHTYGGRICENVVQKIARDCLAAAMALVEEDPGLLLVGHTHDELLGEADEKDKSALQRLLHYMSITPEWAPGLILAADGHEGKRYEKA